MVKLYSCNKAYCFEINCDEVLDLFFFLPSKQGSAEQASAVIFLSISDNKYLTQDTFSFFVPHKYFEFMSWKIFSEMIEAEFFNLLMFQ